MVLNSMYNEDVIPTHIESRKAMSKTKTATKPKYPLIAFRLSEDMARQIATVSKEDKVSKSAVIKSAIEAYLKKRG
jgi:hypothetical protein